MNTVSLDQAATRLVNRMRPRRNNFRCPIDQARHTATTRSVLLAMLMADDTAWWFDLQDPSPYETDLSGWDADLFATPTEVSDGPRHFWPTDHQLMASRRETDTTTTVEIPADPFPEIPTSLLMGDPADLIEFIR